jgi:putative hemolysin
MSTARRATVMFGLQGYAARKDAAKRARAAAQASLRRVSIAFRVSVSASAASFCVTLGALLTLAAGRQPAGNLVVFCVVESLLSIGSIAASFLLNHQAGVVTARLKHADRRLARARRRLLELQALSFREI